MGLPFPVFSSLHYSRSLRIPVSVMSSSNGPACLCHGEEFTSATRADPPIRHHCVWWGLVDGGHVVSRADQHVVTFIMRSDIVCGHVYYMVMFSVQTLLFRT